MALLQYINSNFNFENIILILSVFIILCVIFEKSFSNTLKLAGCFFVIIVMFLGLTFIGMNNMISYVIACLIAICMAHYADKELKTNLMNGNEHL